MLFSRVSIETGCLVLNWRLDRNTDINILLISPKYLTLKAKQRSVTKIISISRRFLHNLIRIFFLLSGFSRFVPAYFCICRRPMFWQLFKEFLWSISYLFVDDIALVWRPQGRCEFTLRNLPVYLCSWSIRMREVSLYQEEIRVKCTSRAALEYPLTLYSLLVLPGYV